MDVNKYIRDKIAADKSLYLHEEHTIVNKKGQSAFVISNDKHRYESAVLTTGGMGDDEVQNQQILDQRFNNVVNMLKEELKKKGIA